MVHLWLKIYRHHEVVLHTIGVKIDFQPPARTPASYRSAYLTLATSVEKNSTSGRSRSHAGAADRQLTTEVLFPLCYNIFK